MKQLDARQNWLTTPQQFLPVTSCNFQRTALAIAVSSLLLGIKPVLANTITVQNTNDSGAGSLRQAVSDSATDDTIDFDLSLMGSTITLSSSIAINKSLTINGDIDNDDYPDVTISGNNATSIFNISAPQQNSNNLEGLIIKDGKSAGSGGAITNTENLVIINSTLTANYAGSYNQPGAGGAIANSGTLSISNSLLTNNSSNFSGGAISHSNGSLSISNTTISGNSSTKGGAIWTLNGPVTLSNSTLSKNSSTSNGGGIYQRDAQLHVFNSTLSGNSASQGAAIFVSQFDNPTVNLTHSTLSNNTAAAGGGLMISGANAAANLYNNIFANSTGSNDCYINPGSSINLGANLIATAGGGCTGTTSDNPNLGALQNNGGITLTHALPTGSPAINAGINADALDSLGNPLITDQRGSGFPRKIGTVDLGAFEFSPCPPDTITLSNTDFSTSDNSFLAATQIQVNNSVNVFANAELTLEAPKTLITDGFHAHSGSSVHITAMNVSCSIPINGNLGEPSLSYTHTAPSTTSTSATPALAPQRLTYTQLPQSLQQLLQTDVVQDIKSFYADAYGDYVIFATAAPLKFNDDNTLHDVYLFHTYNEQLDLISINAIGSSGNGASTQPRIDAAGLYIVYRSSASDIVANDHNQVADIFRFQIDIVKTTRISLQADGNETQYSAHNPVIGGSDAQILYDSEDATGSRQIYRYEELANHLGAELYPSDSDNNKHHPAISADGRFISYLQTADDAGQQHCSIIIDDLDNGVTVQIDCPETLLHNQIITTDFSPAGDIIIHSLVIESSDENSSAADIKTLRVEIANPFFQ